MRLTVALPPEHRSSVEARFPPELKRVVEWREPGVAPGLRHVVFTILVESGVARSLYEAITARDYPIIQGFVVVIAVGYVLVNLIVDLSYAILDPRIQLD